MVKKLPCNAGDMDSILGWGNEDPEASEQLSLCAAITQPTHHN